MAEEISDSAVAPDGHGEPFKTSILKPFGAENGLCSPRTTADVRKVADVGFKVEALRAPRHVDSSPTNRALVDVEKPKSKHSCSEVNQAQHTTAASCNVRFWLMLTFITNPRSGRVLSFPPSFFPHKRTEGVWLKMTVREELDQAVREHADDCL